MRPRRLAFILIIAAGIAAGLAARAAAQATPTAARQGSPVHPPVILLDQDGRSVLESGEPASTLATCGQCHDTAYILRHNTHLGVAANTTGAGWDPLIYRYVSAAGDARPDLDAAGWLRQFGQRTPGSELTEPDCFVCHLAQPDSAARTAALQSADFAWASTASLAATGLVSQTASGWRWNPAAFDAAGAVSRETLGLQDPANANCAQCHSAAHAEPEPPVAVTGCEPDPALTAATGQIFSPQPIAASGLNLAGKAGLARAWDVHAERGVGCTDCHFSPNNPARSGIAEAGEVEHLVFDPRLLELGEYVQRPSHDFSAPAQCTDCHAAEAAHTTLPYAQQHMDALACETCHVPRVYAPALQQVDWTVLTAAGRPRTECRGVEGSAGTSAALVSGYVPALLARSEGAQLAPYNLVTAWYWVYDASPGEARPVRLADLQAAYFGAGSRYAPEVVSALDADADGALAPAELVLDSEAKAAALAARLAALGLANPRIVGEVRPYPINHTIAAGEWATGDCRACHADASRLAEPMALAGTAPGGAAPVLAASGDARPLGAVTHTGSALVYTPDASAEGRYVFGHDRAVWADWLGALAFVGVLAGVAGHGGLRLAAALRAPRRPGRTRRVYMYTVYERFWHWLQTFTIVLLLFTGLIIHRPNLFAVFSFRHVVVVHNVLAGLLVINAALALFYHLASGEIRQFLPRPYGFFDQAIRQAQYYLRGIFRGQPHPFAKTPGRKLNPLQQVTYFGILNVLLPLQVITGVLMWGMQQWPGLAARLGGLPWLAAVHSLAAWLFAAFIVAHVYLTTTGHAPLAGIQAMMQGWEDVEDHAASQEEPEHERADTDSPRPHAPVAGAPEPPAV